MADESPILLVAGLGNPGSRFAGTWHNLGYMALDGWAKRKKVAFKPGRGDFYHLTYKSPRGHITFLKPTSFMNLSGIPVAEVARKHRLSAENVLVVCDDVALPLGTIRIRKSGTDGGHKGLASIIAELGSEDLPRLRLGIFTEGWEGDLSDYVLSCIPDERRKDVGTMLKKAADALDCILNENVTAAMNRYNRHFLEPTNLTASSDNSDDVDESDLHKNG